MSRWERVLVLLVLGALAMLSQVLGAEAQANAKMEAWARAMAPGEPHTALAELAGDWRYVVTFWEEPGTPPATYKGLATKTMILGGRFLQEEISGEPTDHPFKGFGITGYDNVTKQYVGMWLDNHNTGISSSTGQRDSKGVQTFQSSFSDPATGKTVRKRSVARVVDRDHHTYESFVTMPDGKEWLHMRIEYTRTVS